MDVQTVYPGGVLQGGSMCRNVLRDSWASDESHKYELKQHLTCNI